MGPIKQHGPRFLCGLMGFMSSFRFGSAGKSGMLRRPLKKGSAEFQGCLVVRMHARMPRALKPRAQGFGLDCGGLGSAPISANVPAQGVQGVDGMGVDGMSLLLMPWVHVPKRT